MNTFPLSSDYDVTIFGAGVVGLAAGAMLATQGFRVALVDRGDIQKPLSADIDARALAMTPASRQLLEQMGAWSYLPSEAIGPVRKMQIEDRDGQGNLSFDHQHSPQPALAYIIEDQRIQQAIFQALTNLENLHQYPNAAALDFMGDEEAVLSLDDGRKLRSRLLIGADGQRSWVRNYCGIGQVKESYDQKAVVCVIESAMNHDQIARQFFFEQGILALLPMAGVHTTAIVWSTNTSNAERLLALNEHDFCQTLQTAMENTLGAIQSCTKRMSFPLQAAQAETYISERVVLIGDAAHSVHPLAGQGANLGLLDVAALTDVLLHARERQQDFGQRHVLRKYERWRRGENHLMMQAFTSLKEIYEQKTFPVPGLRGLGMNLIDKVTPVKQWLMLRAMGLAGDLPESIQKY